MSVDHHVGPGGSPGAPTVAIGDFDVVDTGGRIAETYDCVRSVVVPGRFADDLESGDLLAWSLSIPKPVAYPVTLSTATPPGGAYSWNDSNPKNL